MKDRREFITPAVCAVFIALVIYFIMEGATPALLARVEQYGGVLGFNEIVTNSQTLDFKWNFLYTVFDFSQGPFLADTIAAICMLIGGVLGRYLEKINSPYAGNGTEGNSTKFVWLVWAQLVAMAVANIFWRHIVGMQGWYPTFAPLVSVTPVSIVFFGKPNFKKAITGILLGAIVPVYAVQFLMTHFAAPLDLPGFAGIGFAIGFSNLLAIELFKRLPWMNDGVAPDADEFIEPKSAAVEKEQHSGAWYVWTRVFGADIAELYFWGSNLSGLGILLGCLISYFLNPNANGFGTLLPEMMFCFIFACSVGMVVWAPKWKKDGLAFTFETLLVVGALVGKYPMWQIAIPVCVIASIIAPAIMHWAMGTKFYGKYHPCVAVQTLGATMTVIGAVIIKLFV